MKWDIVFCQEATGYPEPQYCRSLSCYLLLSYSDLCDAQRLLLLIPTSHMTVIFHCGPEQGFLAIVCDTAVCAAGVAHMMADAFCWIRVISFL